MSLFTQPVPTPREADAVEEKPLPPVVQITLFALGARVCDVRIQPADDKPLKLPSYLLFRNHVYAQGAANCYDALPSHTLGDDGVLNLGVGEKFVRFTVVPYAPE